VGVQESFHFFPSIQAWNDNNYEKFMWKLSEMRAYINAFSTLRIVKVIDELLKKSSAFGTKVQVLHVDFFNVGR